MFVLTAVVASATLEFTRVFILVGLPLVIVTVDDCVTRSDTVGSDRVIQLFEPIETISAVAHDLPGLQHVAPLLTLTNCPQLHSHVSYDAGPRSCESIL